MDPISNKHKYGNYTTMPNKREGFPLDQECLSMTQNNLRLLVVLAQLSGNDYVILSGCGTSGARKPGYVYLRTNSNDLLGEVLYYDGSAPSSNNLHIVTTVSSVTANQTVYNQAYTERYLAGGAGDSVSDTLNWASFKKLTLQSLQNAIDGQASRINSIESIARQAQKGAVPIGSLEPFTGTSAPEGWLFCRGQSVNSSVYPELAAVLGVTGTSFNLPNLQGKFLVGYDPSKSKFALKNTGGAEDYTLTTGNMPQHKHQTTSTTYYVGTQGNGYPDGSMDSTAIGGGGSYPRVTKSTSSLETGSAGSYYPTPVPTLPPYYTVNFIIRAK